MFLHTRSHAAECWGWRNGMQFVNRECDDAFRELLQYITNHNSEGSSGWRLLPCFRRLFREPDAAHEDMMQLILPPDMPDIYNKHTAWLLCGDPFAQPHVCIDTQFMFRMIVQFTPDHTEGDPSLPLSATIQHVQTDPACRFTRPAERYYYIHIHGWIARCAEPAEVVALLDAIQRNAGTIRHERDRRADVYALYAHFESMQRKKWLDNDIPRKQYVQRTMQRLLDGWEDVMFLDGV